LSFFNSVISNERKLCLLLNTVPLRLLWWLWLSPVTRWSTRRQVSLQTPFAAAVLNVCAQAASVPVKATLVAAKIVSAMERQHVTAVKKHLHAAAVLSVCAQTASALARAILAVARTVAAMERRLATAVKKCSRRQELSKFSGRGFGLCRFFHFSFSQGRIRLYLPNDFDTSVW
jgi:hypothetical protein